MYLTEPLLLVLEPDREERDLLAQLLDQLGARVRLEFADDGAALLDRVAAGEPPSLVFCDPYASEDGGVELLHALRALPGGRRLVVLVHTAALGEEQIARAYEAGANACLVKPLHPTGLLDQLQRTLEFWLAAADLPGGWRR